MFLLFEHDYGQRIVIEKWTKLLGITKSTKTLLVACIEQIRKKERRGKKFTTKPWECIVNKFNAKASKQYEKKHLKNRLNVLRKEFKAWERLLNEIGAGREARTNKVVASDEWWEQKIKEDNAYRKFRHNGLTHEKEMRMVFKDVEATPEFVDRPSKGSGDNKDDTFGANPLPSTRVKDEPRGLGFTSNTSIGITGQEAGAKGRYVKGLFRKKGKKKMPVERNSADSFSVHVERSAVVIEHEDVSFDAALNVLFQLEEVQHDVDFRNRCLTLLENKNMRQMLIAMAKAYSKQKKLAKVHDNYLIEWLRLKAN